MKRQLNVGEKFVVVANRHRLMSQNGGMDKYLGKIMTVATNGDSFDCIEDGGRWVWGEDMIDWDATEKLNKLKEPTINSQIKKVLINGQATIVFFTDGTKSVVVHNDDLPYDKEKAIALAIAKKFLGGYTAFKEVLDSVETQEKYAIVVSAGNQYTTNTTFFKGEYAKYLSRYINSDSDMGRSYNDPNRLSLYTGERVKVLVVDGQKTIVEKRNRTIGLIATCALKFL